MNKITMIEGNFKFFYIRDEEITRLPFSRGESNNDSGLKCCTYKLKIIIS